MINPVWLRSFCTLVEVGHFTKTADQLNMTQSGVSQHIKKLEELVGVPLLIRKGKKFSLTNAGHRLFEHGISILNSLDQLEQKVGQDPPYDGVVRVASPGSVGLKLYPYLLELQQRYPRLVIEYIFAPNNEIERMVADHKIDLGLMTSLSTMKDVRLQAIAQETLLLVTPSTIDTPSWEQLMALGFINHPDGAHHASQLLSVNYPQFQHVSQFKRSGFSNQINLILEPVSLALGFTVLPSFAVGAFPLVDKIATHPLKHKVSETLYLGTYAGGYLPSRVKTVMAEIESCLKA